MDTEGPKGFTSPSFSSSSADVGSVEAVWTEPSPEDSNEASHSAVLVFVLPVPSGERRFPSPSSLGLQVLAGASRSGIRVEEPVSVSPRRG